MQDNVATKTRTETLSQLKSKEEHEKLGRDTNLKKQLGGTVSTKKTLSQLKSKEEHGNLGRDTNLQKPH